ncbi:cytochrome P450 4C1 isoform X2 [Anabrus simplex]
MLWITLLACLVVPAILLGLLIWHIKRRHFLQLAAKLPGPKTEFLLGNARELGNNPRDIYLNVMRIWRENGSLVRLWIGPFLYVLMSDAKDVEAIMTSTKYIDKSIVYKFLEPWLGTGLLTGTGIKWHKHRKIITPAFHFKILEQFVDVFNTNGDILIKKLRNEANGTMIDIYDYITLYALDVICETAMGVSINAQENRDSEYARALRNEGEVIMRRLVAPWAYPDFFFNLSKDAEHQSEALRVLHNMTNNVIQERKRQLSSDLNGKNNGHVKQEQEDGFGRKKRFAFLDLLLQAAQSGADLSDENIREEVDTFMFEGHDTTTSGICYALYYLSKDQQVQKRAMEELRSIFGTQSNIAPTYQNICEMKYLEYIIKESLRLCPSVPVIGRHLGEDLTIKTGNLRIPASSSVLISPYLLHRNPDYYDEPEKFDPDRFLPENCQRRHPYAYIPFSAGPRNCIGQKFALLEMKAVISKILWHYHLSSEPSFEPELTIELILKSANGIKLKLTPRTKTYEGACS